MSTIVKGMRLPANCYSCDLADFLSDKEPYCKRTMKPCTKINLIRPEWCPLEEIPEQHGDLIDRDAILEFAAEKKRENPDFLNLISLDLLKAVPVIVKKEL